MSSRSALHQVLTIALPKLLFRIVLVSAVAFVSHPWAQEPQESQEREYGRFGLAVKSGAAAGPMGIQLAWNLSRHFQLCAGGGGTTELLSILDRSRTDSYFVLGKYYLDHLFFESGFARKTTKAELIQGEEAHLAYRTEQAIPFQIGYEFGHRMGFYFSTTAGYFYVLGGGGKRAIPSNDPKPESAPRSAESGPTIGLSVGYYLW